jgi:hypothetical protein
VPCSVHSASHSGRAQTLTQLGHGACLAGSSSHQSVALRTTAAPVLFRRSRGGLHTQWQSCSRAITDRTTARGLRAMLRSIPHNTTRAFGEQFTSNRVTEPQVGFTKAHGKAYERQYLTAEHCKHMVSNYTSALYNVPLPKPHGLNYAYSTMSVRAPPSTHIRTAMRNPQITATRLGPRNHPTATTPNLHRGATTASR